MKSAINILRVPPAIKSNIIRYSSTYDQREVDNYYNLVQQKETVNICQICQETCQPQEILTLPNCNHNYCEECLHNYLLYKVEVGE